MARIGRYKVGFNRSANAGRILMNIVMLIIWLGVGDVVIAALGGIINTNANSIFYKTYQFMGLTGSGSTGIIAIVGILLAVGVLVQAFKVTRA